jgi:hypothetical protein
VADDAEIVSLRYSDQTLLVMGSTAGVVNNLSYKLNSVFNVDGSSGTPQGVADLALKYRKVQVMGSRIRWQLRQLAPGVSVGNLGTIGVAATHSALSACVLYPFPSGGATAASVLSAAVQKYASKRFDWPLIVSSDVIGVTELNPRMTYRGRSSMTVAKLDASPDPRQDSYCSVLGSADPANLCYWVFAFQDLVADPAFKGVWQAEIDIDYDVRCYDRVTLGDSLRERVGPCALSLRTFGPMESKLQDAHEIKLAGLLASTPITPSTPVDARPPVGWTLVRKVASLK